MRLEEKELNTGFLFILECPDTDPVAQNGNPFDFTALAGFILTDSIQIHKPPTEYGLYVKLIPK
jgi:hypothetical protein